MEPSKVQKALKINYFNSRHFAINTFVPTFAQYIFLVDLSQLYAGNHTSLSHKALICNV